MLIKVTKTTRASACPLGIKTKEYLANETYDIYDSLAKVFIKEEWGVAYKPKEEEPKTLPKLQNKAIKKAPNNKSLPSNG